MPAGYTGTTPADVALSAATAKTVISVINAANALIRITEFGVSFDGTTAGNEPVLVELCSSTEATAGTTTDGTPVQMYGPTRTVQADYKYNYTAEPTTLTALKMWLVHPQTGIVVQHPLGREVEQVTTADAVCIRCTAPNTVNARAYMCWEEG